MGWQLSQFTEVAGGVLSKQSTAQQSIKEAKWKASRFLGKEHPRRENSQCKGPGVECAGVPSEH